MMAASTAAMTDSSMAQSTDPYSVVKSGTLWVGLSGDQTDRSKAEPKATLMAEEICYSKVGPKVGRLAVSMADSTASKTAATTVVLMEWNSAAKSVDSTA